jgi:Lrp/AsnC family leucine-responsive transcriptional regulator
MERQGVIMGYHARIDPKLVEKPLLVFVEITLTTKSGEVFAKVRNQIANMPEVLECHLVSGSFDYLVKARLSAMTQYRDLLSNILNQIPVPSQSHSYVVMEEVKESSYITV